MPLRDTATIGATTAMTKLTVGYVNSVMQLRVFIERKPEPLAALPMRVGSPVPDWPGPLMP